MLITPSQISVKPNIMPLMVPEYDFEGQNRSDGMLMAGKYTNSSIQTFNSKGQACDSTSDTND